MSRSLEAMELALRAFESGRAADRAEAMTALRAALITPSRREWVSLTDEEIEAAIGTAYPEKPLTMYDKRITQAIEAKSKEKNSG